MKNHAPKLRVVNDAEDIKECYVDKEGFVRGTIYIPPENRKLNIVKWIENII